MKKYIGKLLLVVILISTLVQFKTVSAEETGVVEQVDINYSDYYELLYKLEGVGEKLTKKIIEARPYSSLDDLKKVDGIGDAKLNAIKAQGLARVSTPEKIYINYASAYDLQYVAGIGAPLAQKIIEQRPFASVDELSKKVVGIGSAKLQAIKAQGIAYVEPTPVFPAKIEEVFPDYSLANYVAESLKKNISDRVLEEELLQVKSLEISNSIGNPVLKNWEGLQYLKGLKSFSCDFADQSFKEGGDFNRFKLLQNIETIWMHHTPLDTSLIVEMKNLRYLMMTDIFDEDLENISKVKSLEDIFLFYLQAEDYSPLGKLINLKSIRIEYAANKNYKSIVIDNSWENLSKLESLTCEWTSFSDVRGLTKLQEKYGILRYSIQGNNIPYDQILK